VGAPAISASLRHHASAPRQRLDHDGRAAVLRRGGTPRAERRTALYLDEVDDDHLTGMITSGGRYKLSDPDLSGP
jgi:hypothetical protein